MPDDIPLLVQLDNSCDTGIANQAIAVVKHIGIQRVTKRAIMRHDFTIRAIDIDPQDPLISRVSGHTLSVSYVPDGTGTRDVVDSI